MLRLTRVLCAQADRAAIEATLQQLPQHMRYTSTCGTYTVYTGGGV